jgi:hypothetical protein
MVPSDARVLGLKPWFPWPLSRWRWLTAPVRAERLAALRIAVGLVMFLDVLGTLYLSRNQWFGPGSLGEPKVFNYRYREIDKFDASIFGFWDVEFVTQRWSLLHDKKYGESTKVDQDNEYRAHRLRTRTNFLLALWVISSLMLTIGSLSRLNAIFCWLMSVSVLVSNSYIDNAGDKVRTLTLFYLMLSPCGAAWSVDAWLRRRLYWAADRTESGEFRGLALVRRDRPSTEPFYVHPWALRLLFVQMMAIYMFNGLAKSVGNSWHEGRSLYNVMADLVLARFSYAMLPVPYKLTQLLTWMVLWWELMFAPIVLIPWHTLADLWKRIPYVGEAHVVFRWTREIVLAFGASFHVGIMLTMEIGAFAPYMLCLYMPLLPWEKFCRKKPDEVPLVEPVDEAEPVPQPAC